MAIQVIIEKQRNEASETQGIKIPVAYLDRETVEKNGIPLLPGWYEWRETLPIAKYVRQEDTAYFVVARAGNKNHRRFIRDMVRANAKAVRRGQMSPEREEEIDVEGFAKYVLLGWGKFKSANGELKYTWQIAKEWLMNDRGLLDFLSDMARDESLFMNDSDIIESGKN
jgi:hypothetical protein